MAVNHNHKDKADAVCVSGEHHSMLKHILVMILCPLFFQRLVGDGITQQLYKCIFS